MWSAYDEDSGSDDDREVDSDAPDSELEALLYSQIHYDFGDSRVQDPPGDSKVQDPPLITIDDEPTVEAKITRVVTPRTGAARCTVDAEQLKGVAKKKRKKPLKRAAAKLNLNSSAPAEVVVLSSDDDVIYFSDDNQHNISLNVLEAPKSTATDSDLWHVDADDRYRADRPSQSFRYHVALAGELCRCCGTRGHSTRSCRGRKTKVCAFCSEGGHNERRCPRRMCSRCYKKGHMVAECKQTVYPFCDLCRCKGHPSERCPDLWRRYHLTTEDGPIVKGQFIMKPPEERYCYNCGLQGHFGHQCSQRRLGFRTTPFIVSYKDPHSPPEPPLVARDEKRKKKQAAKKRSRDSLRLKKGRQNGRATPHVESEQQAAPEPQASRVARKRSRVRPQCQNGQPNGHVGPPDLEQATQGPGAEPGHQARGPPPMKQEDQHRSEDDAPAAKRRKAGGPKGAAAAARKAAAKRRKKAKRQAARRKSYQGEESAGPMVDRPSFSMPNNWRNSTFSGHH
ncbi:uncharacterized protein LOC144143801 [Haemaphysalis longicornis]